MSSLQKSLSSNAQRTIQEKASEKKLQEQVWKLESKCMILEEQQEILCSKLNVLEKKMNEFESKEDVMSTSTPGE